MAAKAIHGVAKKQYQRLKTMAKITQYASNIQRKAENNGIASSAGSGVKSVISWRS